MFKTANNDSISRPNSRPNFVFPGTGRENLKCHGKGRDGKFEACIPGNHGKREFPLTPVLNSYFFWCFSKFVWWYLLLPSDVPAEGPYLSGMTIVQRNNKQHIYQVWKTNNKHMSITGSHEKCWNKAKSVKKKKKKRGKFDLKNSVQ